VSDQVVLAVGAFLGVGGQLLAAFVTRPRPKSVREVAYLVLPLAGAIVLAVLVWFRV
jgi:hypothetical protein